MTVATLSEAEIQALYKFTRQHFVEHYDLQTELVDHLGNGIEKQWRHHPNRSFREALQIEFKKFGVLGFQDVVAEKKKAMRKRYRKLLFKECKAYWAWPKIGAIFLAIIGLGTVFSLLAPAIRYYVFVSGLFIIIALLFGFLFKNRNKHDFKRMRQGRKWLFLDQVYDFWTLPQLVNCIAILFSSPYLQQFLMKENHYLPMLFSAVWVFIVTLNYVALRVIPDKAEELMEDTYPEYKLVKE